MVAVPRQSFARILSRKKTVSFLKSSTMVAIRSPPTTTTYPQTARSFAAFAVQRKIQVGTGMVIMTLAKGKGAGQSSELSS